jgi:hypothetical protein
MNPIKSTVIAMLNEIGELRKTVAIDSMPQKLQQVRQLLRELDADLDVKTEDTFTDPNFSSMRQKAGELIAYHIAVSGYVGRGQNRIGYAYLYKELSEAGLTKTSLVGEDQRLVLDYAESLGFTINRIYPNPVLAGQVYMSEKAKQLYCK